MKRTFRIGIFLWIFFVLSAFAPASAREGETFAGSKVFGGEDFRDVVRKAKALVFPAVVFVKPIRQDFSKGKMEKVQVFGSGVIISRDGVVVTNNHVVEKSMGPIKFMLSDGTVATGKVLGRDKDTDLAVIRLEVPGRKEFPFAELGMSGNLEGGDFCMAMGAPWGLNRSVSLGIISCPRRYLPGISQYSLWIQTDASISPGNSGGPLVDMEGKVIGITALGTIIGGDTGFVVPSETVKRVVEKILEDGEVRWTWTGLRLQALKDFTKEIFFDGDRGVIVASVDEGSPAGVAGMKSGDLLLSLDGQEFKALSEEDLPGINKALGELQPDKPVALEIQREGKEMSLSLTPRLKGKVEGEDFDCRRWNMTVKVINQFNDPSLYYFQKEGIYLFAVQPQGNAATAGLKTGDILVTVGEHQVLTLEDLKSSYQAAIQQEEKRVLVLVRRMGMLQRFVIEFSKDFDRY